jgi:hypothetical protein
MAQSTDFINSSINTGLPATVPEVFQNPEVVAAVRMFINAIQTLQVAIESATGFSQKDASLWPNLTPSDTLLKQNTGRFYVLAGENLAYGAFINIYNDAGIPKARNANSTDHTKPAHGYCNITDGSSIGNYTEVILSQGLLKVSGLNAGDKIFLSPSAGMATLTPDTAAGHLEQFLGYGLGNELAFIDIASGSYIEH